MHKDSNIRIDSVRISPGACWEGNLVTRHHEHSPQASHSITVFFRKTISWIWKRAEGQRELLTCDIFVVMRKQLIEWQAIGGGCVSKLICCLPVIYMFTCCFRSSLISARAWLVPLIWLMISPSAVKHSTVSFPHRWHWVFVDQVSNKSSLE